jgi:hypothetical protein
LREIDLQSGAAGFGQVEDLETELGQPLAQNSPDRRLHIRGRAHANWAIGQVPIVSRVVSRVGNAQTYFATVPEVNRDNR